MLDILGSCTDSLCNIRFHYVLIIDASTVETITSSLELIICETGEGKSAEDAIAWISRQTKEWLMLFDNADDPKMDLYKYLPHCSHGCILITTRNKDIGTYADNANVNIHVSGLLEEDAIQLLLSRAKLENSAHNENYGRSIVKVCKL